MKKHNVLAILLVLLLAMSSLLAGCGGGAADEEPAADPQADQQIEQMEQTGQDADRPDGGEGEELPAGEETDEESACDFG